MPAADPLDELEQLLLDPELPDAVMLLAQVDGLVAAALVAPGLTEDQWLPLVWGGGETPFDHPTRERLRTLLSARKAEVVGELLRGGMAYGPLYDVDPNDDVPLWEPWIEGFAADAALAGKAWETLLDHPDEDLGAAALGLTLLIAAAEQPKRHRDLAEQAPDLIPHLVETLYRRQRHLPRIPAA